MSDKNNHKKMKWLKILLVILVFYPFWGGLLSGAYTFFYGEIYVEKVVMMHHAEKKPSGKRFDYSYSYFVIHTDVGNIYQIKYLLVNDTAYDINKSKEYNNVNVYYKKNYYNFFQPAKSYMIFDLKENKKSFFDNSNILYSYYSELFDNYIVIFFGFLMCYVFIILIGNKKIFVK